MLTRPFPFVLILLLFVTFKLNGQAPLFKISGYVSDNVSHDKLSYVTVIAQTPEKTFVEGTTTDENGKFVLKLSKGKYILNFSFIGYKNEEKVVEINNSQELNFHLEAEIQSLQTIVVNEERTSVEQKIDRKVINVGKDLQSSGGDAIEVLSQIAEVQTNPDGGIELRGSSNVNLLVNGKPSPLAPQDLLQQIDATEIQKIELITSPSAKYRADGLSGIINIITKRNKQKGFLANLNGSLNTNPTYRAGLSLSQGGKNLNLNLNLNATEASNRTRILRSRNSNGFQYTQIGGSTFDGQVRSIKTGLDWFLNEKNEFSLSANYTNNSHLITNTANVEEDNSEYQFRAANDHVHLSADFNANFRHSFKTKDHYLEADFQFSDNRNDLGANFLNLSTETESFLDYNTQIGNWALDYVLPFLDKKIVIESGLLYTSKRVVNQRRAVDLFLETDLDRFDFEEQTLAIYGLIKKDWEAFKIQLGLRYESFQSDSKFQDIRLPITRNFNNFFPSAHFSYRFSDKSSMNLGYNRRISRPGLWNINPFANASDPFFNRRGNPSLNPEFSDNLEWNYSFTQGKWSLNPGIFFRRKSNLILPLYESDEENTVFQSYINEGNSTAYGLELALSLSPFKFLRTNLSSNIYWEKLRGVPDQNLGFVNLRRYNWTLKNLFKIHKNLNLDLTWIYRGGSTYRYSQAESFGKIDMALRWKVLKGKGSINARLTDVFNTAQYESILFGDGFEENTFRKGLTRVGYLSFNYKFASLINLKKRNRKNRRMDKSGALE